MVAPLSSTIPYSSAIPRASFHISTNQFQSIYNPPPSTPVPVCDRSYMDGTFQAVVAAVGSFLVVSLILASVIYICQGGTKRRRGDRSVLPTSFPLPNPNSSPPDSRVSNASNSIGASASFDPNLQKVSMKELVNVTRNFSPDLIIGDGSFGLVYKARLNSGSIVAVKKLDPHAYQGLREFHAEMETLGKIYHANIVKILGYCSTGDDRVLIYEFIEKGSLDQWLYDTSSQEEAESRFPPLSWHNRMKIIKGVALGLAHMHSLETPIIHRDIKASNILLDANFEAHVADFGLARLMERSHTHISTQVAGTMGYMPPEYLNGYAIATMQGDVYSFGVLMLEIVTGRRPSSPFSGEDGKGVRLVEWVNQMAEQNRYMEMVDAAIFRDDLKEGVVVNIFNIGVKCASERSKLRPRPSMNAVVSELNQVLG